MHKQRFILFCGPVSEGQGCRGRPNHQSPLGGVAEGCQGWVKSCRNFGIFPKGSGVAVAGGGQGGNRDIDDNNDRVRFH